MSSIVYELQAPFSLQKQQQNLNITQLGNNEIYAKTKYSVISTGTEIAAWSGLPPLRPSKVYPRLMGYCNLARVEKIGSDVNSIAIGDYILTHQSHRSDFVCKEQEVLFSCRDCNSETLQKITATYIYHLGYSALLNANFMPGLKVAVIGMGAIGITLSGLLQAFGTKPFIFTNQVSSNFSSQNSSFIFSKKDNLDNFYKLTGDLKGVDIVINTSNSWEDYLLSLKLARTGGSIVCIGFPGRGIDAPSFNPLDSQYIYDKQLTIKHCGYVPEIAASPIDIRFTLKRNIEYLASLILDNKIDPNEILSMSCDWKNLAQAYNKLSVRNSNLYSALIKW